MFDLGSRPTCMNIKPSKNHSTNISQHGTAHTLPRRPGRSRDTQTHLRPRPRRQAQTPSATQRSSAREHGHPGIGLHARPYQAILGRALRRERAPRAFHHHHERPRWNLQRIKRVRVAHRFSINLPKLDSLQSSGHKSRLKLSYPRESQYLLPPWLHACLVLKTSL